ncbi:MAG: DUF4861 family protein [Bacteroidales bacterium]|nr:DUF4861 family protein [Bacteroidales bacterium]
MKRTSVFVLAGLLLFAGACSHKVERHTFYSQFLRTDSLQVEEIWAPDGKEPRAGHHGPAVENRYMALRFYLDGRSAIDVYSKSGLIDDELGRWLWYPSREAQEKDGAGCDEYFVGRTVGLGGVRLWNGENEVEMVPSAGLRSLVGRTEGGAYMEKIFYGVPYLADTIDVSVRVDVSDVSRWAVVSARELSGKPVRFVTGVNYHPGSEILRDEGLAAVWGCHPADVSSKPVPIGGAIRFNPSVFPFVDDTGNTVRLVSEPVSGFSTEIVSASVKEAELCTAERFFDFVKR